MKKFFIHKDNQQQGPFSTEELIDLRITRDTMVWYEGEDNWKKATEVDELQDFFKSIPPPIDTYWPVILPPQNDNATNKIINTTFEEKPVKKIMTLILIIVVALLVGGIGTFIYTNQQAKQSEIQRQFEERIEMARQTERERKAELESLNNNYGQDITKSQDKLTKENITSINQFVQLIRLNKKEQLAEKIIYPIERQYPLPNIKNSKEFIQRFDEIFDSNIISKLVSSDIKNDWTAEGLRGIMFANEDLCLDYDGNLISIKYQSDFEKKKINELTKNEKQIQNKQVQSFKKTIHLLETDKFKIRIDELGNEIYSYTAWDRNVSMNTKPNLFVSNGNIQFDSNSDRYSYFFTKNDYTYEVSIIVIGESDSPPATLTVRKNGKEISTQNAKIISK